MRNEHGEKKRTGPPISVWGSFWINVALYGMVGWGVYGIGLFCAIGFLVGGVATWCIGRELVAYRLRHQLVRSALSPVLVFAIMSVPLLVNYSFDDWGSSELMIVLVSFFALILILLVPGGVLAAKVVQTFLKKYIAVPGHSSRPPQMSILGLCRLLAIFSMSCGGFRLFSHWVNSEMAWEMPWLTLPIGWLIGAVNTLLGIAGLWMVYRLSGTRRIVLGVTLFIGSTFFWGATCAFLSSQLSVAWSGVPMLLQTLLMGSAFTLGLLLSSFLSSTVFKMAGYELQPVLQTQEAVQPEAPLESVPA